MALLLEIMGLVGTSACPTTFGEEAHKSFLIERCEPPLRGPPSLAGLPELETCVGSSRRAHITSWIKVSWWRLLNVGKEATGCLGVFILGNTYTSGHCLQVAYELCANETLLIWSSGIFLYLPSSYFLLKKSENLNYSSKKKMYPSFPQNQCPKDFFERYTKCLWCCFFLIKIYHFSGRKCYHLFGSPLDSYFINNISH